MGSTLVLDANARHGVVAIRSLGARGVDVTAGSASRWSAGGFSRHVDRHVVFPSPENDPSGFVRDVEAEVRARDYDMLLPISEATVEVVSEHRDRFEPATTLPFPPEEQLAVGVNKRRTVEAAREHDVPHPETVLPGEGGIDAAVDRLGYPVVVKTQRGEGGNGTAVCHTRRELEYRTRDLRASHGPVIFQEFVPNGGERGVYTLYGAPGELTALTVQQRLRTRPPSGGASTYRETVVDPELVELADEFLAALDWYGLAMVEFRVDARTGEPQLLEINPRLWGSLALSVYAGVNFPYLLYRVAVGDEPEPDLEYDVGVQARCLFTDALQVLDREDTLTAVREFVTPASKPCCYDLVSRSDPLPALGQVLYWASVYLDDEVEDDDEGPEAVLPEVPIPKR
ncbi:ATP-grasp domain-containing protein [Halobacterium sp. R2-5]|uniref:carboxylate--amine ligase n=1 Tax=Halobacterium sp. R2-5 TaxID=2715751 RepID=UPI0014201C26|nr:ATP-grasp domain-containing protein [Halobacterium sp. R2-5]NIB99997.1 ATP-grasp domain-containing protein [Halobacterium sp. R2-5]